MKLSLFDHGALSCSADAGEKNHGGQFCKAFSGETLMAQLLQTLSASVVPKRKQTTNSTWE
jgi:hypothetical protein